MFTRNTSLVIPTKNRSEKLIYLLKKIQEYNIFFREIIIVDSSEQNHKKKIINFIRKKKIRLINSYPSTTHQRNLGLIKAISSEYVLFLDDDIKIQKNSFKEMNNAIKKYKKLNDICSYAFNLSSNQKKFKNESFKKGKILKFLGLYSNQPGKVLKSGWHTKISNLKNDTYVDWVYSGATIFKSNKIKKLKFKNLNKGFNYLEDLHFSFKLTKKKLKHIVIAKAKVKNPNFIERNDFEFGFIEIVNRHQFVKYFKLNKLSFYVTAILRTIYLILGVLEFKTSWIKRMIGNYYGILNCLIKEFKK